MKRSLALLVLAVVAVSCTGGGPTPVPSKFRETFSVPELKLRVLSAIGNRLDYCDPDVYPVAHGTRLGNALEHLGEIRSHRDLFQAILHHEGISAAEAIRGAGLVRVYTVYKEIAAIQLRRQGDRYRFSVYQAPSGGGSDHLFTGSIDRFGDIQDTQLTPSGRPNCPICLARGVLIATPSGPIAVQDVRVGVPVWSVDRQGNRISAVVLRTRRLPAQGELLRIQLEDGRVVEVSPRHPTADGRLVGALRMGSVLAGSRIRSIAAIPYTGFTYDLLPSGPTGDYFADGVLLGSTLRARVRSPLSS